MALLDVDGLRIGYDMVGHGPPLVLCHGAVCDRRVWREQMTDLADAFTVIAWDVPGCGESSDPPEHFRLQEFAHCLARFLRAVDVRHPHVVGHSWGAGLALQLAIDEPELPASLVLVGGYAGWAGSLPPDEVAARLAVALDVSARLDRAVDPFAFRGLFSDRMSVDRAAHLVTVMRDIRPPGTRVMARAFAEANLRSDLPRITAPVLLLHGDADERSPRDVAEALHEAISTSTLVLVPGLGHELVLEAPELFSAAVRSFVGGLTTAQRG